MKSKFLSRILVMSAACLLFSSYAAFADEVVQAGKNVTLWELLKAGGWTMVVLAALSIVTLSIAIYNFMNLNMKSLAPIEFTENLILRLEAHDMESARLMCEKKKNIISSIALTGIKRRTKGNVIMREAMENTARREVGKLWQNIAYLGDIAAIAPLLGLFGTVLGMIQAFNMISSAGAGLKPIMLVGGISMSLVTTAAGLVVAIPALAFYSYFRGKVQVMSDNIAGETADLMKSVEQASPSSSSRINGILVKENSHV